MGLLRIKVSEYDYKRHGSELKKQISNRINEDMLTA